MEGQGCCKEKSAENACSTTEKSCGCGNKNCGCEPTTGKCCPMTVLKGAVVGAIIMFVWFFVSYMVLPWHKGTTLTALAPDELKIAHASSFALYFVGAALLTKILKKRQAGCCPLAGSIIIGLLVGLFGYLPNVIWFHAPINDALVGIADDVIAIGLAGAAIGCCVLKQKLGCCKSDNKSCDTGEKKTGCCN